MAGLTFYLVSFLELQRLEGHSPVVVNILWNRVLGLTQVPELAQVLRQVVKLHLVVEQVLVMALAPVMVLWLQRY